MLKLENDKYYVGITQKSPEYRMKEHARHINGAHWTHEYKPLSLYDKKDLGRISKSQAEDYENKAVREYAKAKGIENVRGGNLKNIELDAYILRFGLVFTKDSWSTIKVTVILTAIIIALWFAV